MKTKGAQSTVTFDIIQRRVILDHMKKYLDVLGQVVAVRPDEDNPKGPGPRGACGEVLALAGQMMLTPDEVARHIPFALVLRQTRAWQDNSDSLDTREAVCKDAARGDDVLLRIFAERELDDIANFRKSAVARAKLQAEEARKREAWQKQRNAEAEYAKKNRGVGVVYS
jgi:hypothetical protein